MVNTNYLALKVPFAEKDQAKKLFARWDAERKNWYATNRKYYYKFKKWIPGEIVVTDFLGILQGVVTCWKCGKQTHVSSPAITALNTIDIEDGGTITDFSGFDVYSFPWETASAIMPKQFVEYGRKTRSIKRVFSKTKGYAYLGNVCEHCTSLQGNFFLYEEPDSPFLYESATPLVMERVRLGNGDFVLPFNSVTAQISPNTNILSRVSFAESDMVITDY